MNTVNMPGFTAFRCTPCMETYAFGFRLRANAPEGQKRFPISLLFTDYFAFRLPMLRPLTHELWNRTTPKTLEGISLEDSRAIKAAVKIPVLCTGGFQTASLIRNAIQGGACDAVTRRARSRWPHASPAGPARRRG